MKKAPLIITASIVILVAAILFFLQYLNSPKRNLLSLVPANAIAVFQKDDCKECLTGLSATPAVKTFSTATLPSDSSINRIINAVFGYQSLIVSLHLVQKDKLDLVFYFPSGSGKSSAFDKVMNSVKAGRRGQREFNGYVIEELQAGTHMVSWVNEDDYTVFSLTPILIEDVVRTFGDDENNFARTFADFETQKIKGDGGNIYFRLDKLSELVGSFNQSPSPSLSAGSETVLDLKQEDQILTATGFSRSSGQVPSLLKIFSSQAPQPFLLKQFVPDNTIYAFAYGLSNGDAFASEVSGYPERKPYSDSLQWLAQKHSLSVPALFTSLGSELVVGKIERGNTFSNYLILRTKDRVWQQELLKLGALTEEDTILFEQYGSYEIRDIPLYRFPEKVLYPLVTGFDHSYYVVINDVIILADDLPALRTILERLENDETWGKSLQYNKFLETTLLESNISLFADVQRTLNYLLTNRLHPRWSQFITSNRSMMSQFSFTSAQFSNLNKNFYTHASIGFTKGKITDEASSGQRLVVNFPEALAKIWTVRNHANKTTEFLVQDSLHTLHLVSEKGETLWNLNVGQPILGNIQQLDFYKNGKLQYFFVTGESIHIVDRLGRYVEQYPLKTSSPLAFGTIVDYDQSKKYRLLTADRQGVLFLYDKEGTNLEGWRGKDAGGALVSAPEHYRVRGKDFVVVVRADGNIFLYTRRGDLVKGFPVQINSRLSGDYYVEQGKTLGETYIVTASADGYLNKVSFEGKMNGREMLVKTSANSKFSLLRERSRDGYLVMQQDNNQVTIGNSDNAKIVTNSLVNGATTRADFFSSGGGRIVIRVTDYAQGLTFLYNEKGDNLLDTPLDASEVSVLPDNNGGLMVVYLSGTSLIVQPAR